MSDETITIIKIVKQSFQEELTIEFYDDNQVKYGLELSHKLASNIAEELEKLYEEEPETNFMKALRHTIDKLSLHGLKYYLFFLSSQLVH